MEDIVFLAPKKYKNTKLYSLGIKLSETGSGIEENGIPGFATIQGYKGLDSKIIILCDVEDIYESNYSRYIYIAATRARALLYIVGSSAFWEKHG